MDTNQFVLNFAAFMVVVTLIFAFSQWDYRPTPKTLPRVACSFDRMCRGGDCADPMPVDIVILPKAEDGRAYYYDAGFETRRNALETVSDREWVARSGTTGMIRLKLQENGALTITETAGFYAGSAVLTTTTGFCIEAGKAMQEQG